MKKLILIISLSLYWGASYSQFSKANLQASGLTCALCNNAIYKALHKLSFVESVRSDIKNSVFQIIFKKNEQVNIDALRNAVEDAGFSVDNLKLTAVFYGIKLQKDSHIKIGSNFFHFLNGEGKILDGEYEITVVDRKFVNEKKFKKFISLTNMSCYLTGRATDCCLMYEGIAKGARIYHVTF